MKINTKTCSLLCAALALTVTASLIATAPLLALDPVGQTPPAQAGIGGADSGPYKVSAGGNDVAVVDLVQPAQASNGQGTQASLVRPLIASLELPGGKPVPVVVRLASGLAPSTVVIRPLSAHITPTVQGSSIRFALTKPVNLDIEINGMKRPLFFFANARSAPPSPGPNVTIVNSGEVRTSNINLDGKTNQTVYLAPGSVLDAQIVANDASGIHIYGPGIVLGDAAGKGNRMWMRNVKDVTVDGPVLVNNLNEWTAHIINGSDLTFKNLKIVSVLRDGLDLDSCDTTTVSGAFVYSLDDSICIKSIGYLKQPDGSSYIDGRVIHGIHVLNSTIWQGGNGNALKIDETDNAPLIHDILWQNIDVIHKENMESPDLPNAVLTLHEDSPARIQDVTFRDIRIEDVSPGNPFDYLVDVRTSWKNWTTQGTGGIQDVVFDGLSCTSNYIPPIAITGYPKATVENVSFSNLRYHGRLIKDSTSANLEPSLDTHGVTFTVAEKAGK